jgi:hypothetical protein
MNRSNISISAALLAAVAAAIIPAHAEAAATLYPTMAPLSKYLMSDRQSEIDLARTAAPKSISSHATVWVLSAQGYETAVQGTNGFTCEVERPWTKAFDDDNFWNPKVLTPICFNAPATRTVLPYLVFETKLALAGASEATIRERLTAAVAAKQLPDPENGAVGYMMSKVSYIDDHVKAWHSHIMIYTPKALGANGGESWGANRDGSPVEYDTGHLIWPQPWALFFVPVPYWSDGTADPMSAPSMRQK